MYNVDRLRPIKRVHVDKLHHRISAHEKVKEAIIRASIHTYIACFTRDASRYEVRSKTKETPLIKRQP
jgi:hypothetical protein